MTDLLRQHPVSKPAGSFQRSRLEGSRAESRMANFSARPTRNRWRKSYGDIDKLEKSTVSVKKYQQYRDLFPACIMAGCGLLVAQLLLSQTIWKKLPMRGIRRRSCPRSLAQPHPNHGFGGLLVGSAGSARLALFFSAGERRSAARLAEFVAPRLLAQLGAYREPFPTPAPFWASAPGRGACTR